MDGGKGAVVTGVAEDAEEDDAIDGNSREGVETEEEDDEAEDDENVLRGTARSASNSPGIRSLPCMCMGWAKMKVISRNYRLVCVRSTKYSSKNNSIKHSTADRSQQAHTVQDKLLDRSPIIAKLPELGNGHVNRGSDTHSPYVNGGVDMKLGLSDDYCR